MPIRLSADRRPFQRLAEGALDPEHTRDAIALAGDLFETVAAAETVEGAVQLVLGCTICLGTDQWVVFEALTEPTAPRAPERPAATAAPPETSPTEADPGPDPTPFRSGLTEADLGLLPEDLREFV